MSTPWFFCTWGRRGNDEGNKNTQQQKRVLNNAAIFAASSPSVSFSSPSSSSLAAFVLPPPHSHSFTEYHLALPLNPPLRVHTLRCTLKKRLEETKWEGCYYSDDTSTALLFQGNSGGFSFIFNMRLCLNVWEVTTRQWHLILAQTLPFKICFAKLHNVLESLCELWVFLPVWVFVFDDGNNYRNKRKKHQTFQSTKKKAFCI